MSKTSRQPSRCVFIGNIAYDASKEQLLEVFKEVGPVVNFRMVTDRDTGKPRGFAFCEYKDEASALSAIRNLTGREVNGRQLRVDFADNHKINMPGDDEPEPVMTKQPKKKTGFGGGMFDQGPAPSSSGGFPPAMSVGVPPAGFMQQGNMDGMSSAAPPPGAPMDPIMSALSQVPRAQLYDAVAQMKQIVLTDPERARQLLEHTPSLAVVMLHIQYMLGMLKTPFQTQPQAPPTIVPEQPVPAQLPPPMAAYPMMAPPMGAPMQVAPPLGMPPQGQQYRVPPQMQPQMGPMPTMPPQMQPQMPPQMAPPQMAMPPQQPPPQQQAVPPQIQQLLKTMSQQQIQQILSLTPQQLDKLGPQERAQLIAIQQSVRSVVQPRT